MNKRETVQALADSIQRGDFEVVKSMLADGFQFSGFNLAWNEHQLDAKPAV